MIYIRHHLPYLKDIPMKFSDLKIMTQIAAAGDLSTLISTVSKGYFLGYTGNSSVSEPVVNSVLTNAGLTLDLVTLSDIHSVNMTITPPVDKPVVSLSFIRHGDKASMFLNLPANQTEFDTLNFDRFGLTGSIIIDNNLQKSLEDIAAMLSCYTDLVSGIEPIMDILLKLIDGAKLAEALDEEVLTQLHGAKSGRHTFAEISKIINSRDGEYNEDTGEYINLPPIVNESNFNTGVITKFTHNYSSANQNQLVTKYIIDSHTGDESIDVNYCFNGSDPINIGKIEMDKESPVEEFINTIVTKLPALVNESPYGEKLKEQVKHLVNSIVDATPFILAALVK